MSEFQPTWKSLDSHEIPDWFHEAKLGIFIHWGVYSVPAWAPSEAAIDGENASPYAEWYPCYMYEEESPTQEYHHKHYDDDVEYVDFIDDFTAANWDPDEWADLFADVGANYVVLTGEHHDGFPLWETHYSKYNAAERGPERDLVGDLCEAVRDRDLRFAASYHANLNYYQPGYQGRFGHPDYQGGGLSAEDAGPGSEYVDFMNAKHRELIRKYKPDLLWFDVPMADADHLNAKELIADYYNAAEEWDKEVVVNDRASIDAVGPTIDIEEDDDGEFHGDFVTPEYTSFDEIRENKWEACRGIGNSFGYNRAESDDDHLTPEQLIHSFVDIVSKNGNLLLNVGPKADGTIPEIQRDRLVALGDWLEVNGDAIFGTRPWIVAEDGNAVEVRYTHRDGDLFAVALEWAEDGLSLSVPAHVNLSTAPDAALLTPEGEVTVTATLAGDELELTLPDQPATDHAYTVKLSDVENPRAE